MNIVAEVKKLCTTHTSTVGWDSLVGVAVCYRLDNTGIEYKWGVRLPAPVETGPWAHPPSCRTDTRSLSFLEVLARILRDCQGTQTMSLVKKCVLRYIHKCQNSLASFIFPPSGVASPCHIWLHRLDRGQICENCKILQAVVYNCIVIFNCVVHKQAHNKDCGALPKMVGHPCPTLIILNYSCNNGFIWH
jgi:hypothetical protein